MGYIWDCLTAQFGYKFSQMLEDIESTDKSKWRGILIEKIRIDNKYSTFILFLEEAKFNLKL